MDLTLAIINGIFEVCERDALAITWERRLPLTELDEHELDSRGRQLLGWKRANGVVSHLFDATSELGIPTVYELEIAPWSEGLAQLVGCASAHDLPTAAARALKESVATRVAVQGSVNRDEPADRRTFSRVEDGAVVMGHPSRREAFRFLTAAAGRLPRFVGSPLPRVDVERPEILLEELLARLTARGIDVYVADLSTVESRAHGRFVVRVVIPQLQPFSVDPFTRYRGHPRLYNSYGSSLATTEDDLNPDPQPFA